MTCNYVLNTGSNNSSVTVMKGDLTLVTIIYYKLDTKIISLHNLADKLSQLYIEFKEVLYTQKIVAEMLDALPTSTVICDIRSEYLELVIALLNRPVTCTPYRSTNTSEMVTLIFKTTTK